MQQAALPVHLPLLGNNEHRLHGSRARFVAQLNQALRDMAEHEGVDILAVDDRAARDGIGKWHDPGLWHRSKQEIAPPAGPLYGDLVGRWLAAKQGRSFKCLVLDLDNTLWGGVIGDDGMEGIALGQGSALGEAYVAFQDYARELARRGVILAVCSKNDEANALEPFEQHPDMVLRRADISSFVANWSDKAANIRAIAQELNIGLDALVFVDDNPFERNLVRQELPMVAVPEVSDDPTGYPVALADAGYFEALSVTDEDRERTAQYQGNKARDALKASVTDLPAYLRGLEMQLVWKRFDRIGQQRIVQLINKSNQFNLTTRRYTDEDVLAVMEDQDAFGLQLRLLDRFGDNGVIAIIVGRRQPDNDLLIDTWLMSCRVLGRQVEPTTLNLIAQEAAKLGARRLVGEYIPTKKNGMVKGHYTRLGFTLMETDENGASRAVLDLRGYRPAETFIHVVEG
jgi:FkbH-like protein